MVIGVTPPGFFGLVVGKSFDVALPICERKEALAMRNYWWLVVMGRLKRDWTLAKASEHLNIISPGIFEATAPTGYGGSTNQWFGQFLAGGGKEAQQLN